MCKIQHTSFSSMWCPCIVNFLDIVHVNSETHDLSIVFANLHFRHNGNESVHFFSYYSLWTYVTRHSNPCQLFSYDWFSELGLEWYAVPGVSNMMFDCGGIEYTAAPFNGWYMGTEVGSRDFCDESRYNVMQVRKPFFSIFQVIYKSLSTPFKSHAPAMT